MASEIEILPNNGDRDRFDITLPVSKEDFSEFIGRIIGGKDKLDYKLTKSLNVDRQLLIAIEGELKDRVFQNYNGSVVSTRYGIRFSDGKGVHNDSLEKIFHLSPQNHISTSYLTFEFVFLITYPSTASPAREKVSITLGGLRDYTFGLTELGSIELEYVNRVWAEDTLRALIAILERTDDGREKPSLLERLLIGMPEEVVTTGTFIATLLIFCGGVYAFGEFLHAPVNATGIDQSVAALAENTRPYILALNNLILTALGLGISVIPTMLLHDMRQKVFTKARLIFELFDGDKLLLQRQKNATKSKLKTMLFTIGSSIVLGIAASYIYDMIKL